MPNIEELISIAVGRFRDEEETKEIIEQKLAKAEQKKNQISLASILKRIKTIFQGQDEEEVFIPLNVLKNIKNAPFTKDGDILIFEDPGKTLTPNELRYLIHHLGPAYGPEEISFPSPLEKILFLAHLYMPDIYPIPGYKHSCPDIDKILMGMVPYSNFVDTSRAGLAMLLAKAFEYARRSSDKYVDSNNQIDFTKMDEKTRKFVEVFGLISCVPITDRSTLFDFANDNDLEVASIGGSSIAESFYASCRIFGNKDLKQQISGLAGGGWLNGKDREGTSKIKTKFIQYISRNYPQIYQLLNFEETPEELKKYLASRYPNHPHPHVKLLADIMMEMVKKYTVLPKNKKQRESTWKQNAYGTHTRLERVSTKDVSEVVLSRGFDGNNNHEPLPPMPWQAFVLFPHTRYDKDGQVIAQFADMQQLVKAAELIKKYYPDAIVYIPTENGQAIGYDIAREDRVKKGEELSGTNAMLSVIAHLTTSPKLRK